MELNKFKEIIMNQIKIAQAPLYTSPNPMTFICSKKANGKTNMATLAFWTYASTNPGKVVFSLNKGAYTLELLAKNNEVVIAVPGAELAGALIACGTVPELTRLAIVAKVNSTVDADDHILHICDVTTVYADDSVEAVFGWNGYAELAPAQKK